MIICLYEHKKKKKTQLCTAQNTINKAKANDELVKNICKIYHREKMNTVYMCVYMCVSQNISRCARVILKIEGTSTQNMAKDMNGQFTRKDKN